MTHSVEKQSKKDEFVQGVGGLSKKPSFKKSEKYFNREISWLEFNQRVLDQSISDKTPLLERLRFCDIFISNLDEFYMKRVGRLRNKFLSPISYQSADGLSPGEELSQIRNRVTEQMVLMNQTLDKLIYPALKNEGIKLAKWEDVSEKSKKSLSETFKNSIFPISPTNLQTI